MPHYCRRQQKPELEGVKLNDSIGTGTEIVLALNLLLPHEVQFFIFQPDNEHKCLLSSEFINEAKVNQAWKCFMDQAITVLGKPSAHMMIL